MILMPGLTSRATARCCLWWLLSATAWGGCSGVVDAARTEPFGDTDSGVSLGTGGANSIGSPKGTGGGAVLPSGSGGGFTDTGGSGTGGAGTGGSGTGGAGTGGLLGNAGTGGSPSAGSGGPDGGLIDAGPGAGGHPSADGGGPSDGSLASSDAGSAAPTWTEIYTTLLNNTAYASNCAGSACHNPGTQKNIKLASSAVGYSSIRAIVSPPSTTTGNLIKVLTSGSMPQGRPKMATADLNKIKAWISAGALNN